MGKMPMGLMAKMAMLHKISEQDRTRLDQDASRKMVEGYDPY
jgi:hypothetical protein